MTEEDKKESQLSLYKKEMDQDLQLDRINLEDKQLKLPAIKAKWVGRLMNHKKEKDKLYELKDKAIEQISDKIKKESQIEISNIAAEKQAETHDLIKKIKKEIKDQDILIEYLEKMERHVSNVTYDIKNAVDIIKMETM